MVMELARPEDRSALMEIYDRCFPGEHEYGEFYFDRFWKPERTLVARIDGKTAAMLHLIRQKLVLDGHEIDAEYLYAVGTLSEYRGRGIMGGMIEYAKELSRQWGAEACILLTQNDGLFDYYKRFGFEPLFFRSKVLPDENMPMFMCKVRLLDGGDAQAMAGLYSRYTAEIPTAERGEKRFVEILDEYSGHAFGLFDQGGGTMLSYCLMDDENKYAMEVIGAGCGYLLYTCCMDAGTGWGWGLPLPDGSIPVGSAVTFTPEAGRLLAGRRAYLNILFN